MKNGRVNTRNICKCVRIIATIIVKKRKKLLPSNTKLFSGSFSSPLLRLRKNRNTVGVDHTFICDRDTSYK